MNRTGNATEDRPLRVVVVDDSAFNRRTLASIIEALPGVSVVGRAGNGKEALKMVLDERPDVVTLDLEMPEMDGFAFLRLLMARQPIPVIVVSGYSGRENVFRALELGALDFVAKPSRTIGPDLNRIAAEVQQKIELVRRLQAVRLRDRAYALLEQAVVRGRGAAVGPPAESRPATAGDGGVGPPAAERIVVIGSSTGGPPTLQLLLGRLDPKMQVAVVVAQHMPPRFTSAFAERLDRVLAVSVKEAEDGEVLRAGMVYIAPGGQHITVIGRPGAARVRVEERDPSVAVAPSADRLFASAAEVFGDRTVAVVLTGMGQDGARGVVRVAEAGGTAMAEDPDRAVMPGMPAAAVATGRVSVVDTPEGLADRLEPFACGERGPGSGPAEDRLPSP